MNYKGFKVTVLMPVYNGEKYIREAIASILNQTFRDFEFLIINDGSTDRSVEIINSYKDPRIRLVHNENNLKLIATLNKGLDLSVGEYLVRMDCDDIALPERIKKQVSFMDGHPDVVVSGTWLKTVGNGFDKVWTVPRNHEDIRCRMLFEDVIYHPTVIMRLKPFKDHGIYYRSFIHAEDYELWVRIMEQFKVANIDEVLLYYRVHPGQIVKKYKEIKENTTDRIRLIQLHKLGIYLEDNELEIHRMLSCNRCRYDRDFVKASDAWLNKLQKRNEEIGIYSKIHFAHLLANIWFCVCNSNALLGLWSWRAFWKSPLSVYANIGEVVELKFLMKCLIKWKRHGYSKS